jgi:hypothetical protein
MIGQGGSIPADTTIDVTFNFPGAFCVDKMFIQTGDFATPALVFLQSLKVGLNDSVISGSIWTGLFHPSNHCCPDICLDCVCRPGVPIIFTLFNDESSPVGFLIQLFGCYEEACPPR